MKNKASSESTKVNVDMRIGILDTIAKSIYADPKVKIREAVANSMDNKASWFIMYMDPPSRSISLMDSGKGITKSRFEEIFQHIGFGLGREDKFSNSYFGLGLMSILELGDKATIITKSIEEKEIWKLEVNSKEIFSKQAENRPIREIETMLSLKVSDSEERERLSIIPGSVIEKRIGGFPDSFTEILLNDIKEDTFVTMASGDFENELRKILPLKPRPEEPFFNSIKDSEAVKWIKEVLNNEEFCPSIDVYLGTAEGGKELNQIWKYYPDFRRDLEFGDADIVCKVKSYKDSKNIDRQFAFYYITAVEDLDKRSTGNIETGVWIRNKNFLVKEADYLQEPGTRQVTLHQPLKNWLFGEVFHKGMTDFLVVTRNEYNWKSNDFIIFKNQIMEELKPLNIELRKAWQNNKVVSDLVIQPFLEMTEDENPLKRCYGTLKNIGIIEKPEQVEDILNALDRMRKKELEDEGKSIEKLIKLRKEEIVLADDAQIRVLIDPALSGKQEFLRRREKNTNRIIARLSPELFSSRKVKFLEKGFDVFFVAAVDSAPGFSVDKDTQRIFINPFNQDICKYSLSFIDVYIAVELAYVLSKSKEEMKEIMLALLGTKVWKESESPRKYLRALNDELQRRLVSTR
jgi:hypothetical protein